MTDKDLLARIARSAGGKAGYKQLVRELGLGGGRERRLLLEQLARLTARGQLAKLEREIWSIPRPVSSAGTGGRENYAGRDNLAAGRLDLHRDGFGFVRPNSRQASGVVEDIFIPPNEINGAMQGDQVLVELDPPKADGRRQGRIARILERRNPTVVGVFHYARSDRAMGHNVVPFDERMSQPILIPPGEEIPSAAESATPHRVMGAERSANPGREAPEGLEGLVVDVEITSWPTPTRPAIGRVIEVLGSPDDFGVDVEMMIRKHQLPRIFPANVLAEARAVAHFDPEEANLRRDFRSLPIVTIDGESARDFDDAVLVTDRADGGYELQVHIADVAEYVRAGTDLDLEARLRGTSVYFPDRAIPMLPQELSTGICSLRPNEDRLVLSCIMQLDPAGRIESYEIVEGVICSAARMTYTAVTEILDLKENPEQNENPDRDEKERKLRFERMKKLAVLMNKRREQRGSIDFDLPEPVIEFDEHGQMRGVTRAERTWANRLIEEFMLAANECVATWLEDLGVPSLYRIHEKPEPRRVVQFEELAAGFGYSLGLGALPVKRIQTRAERRDAHGRGRNPRQHEIAEDIAVTPRMYQKLAARIEGKPEERILSYLMLRSLRQARYSEINDGHFALAATCYTHFTSPIRRFPDLLIHRILKGVLAESPEHREGALSVGSGGHVEQHAESMWSSAASADKGKPKKTAGRSAKSAPQIVSPIPEDTLRHQAEDASFAERRADAAERELVEWKKMKFMADRVGEDFDGLIVSITKYGIFVELTDLFVEGLIPLNTMYDDRYTFHDTTRQIIGQRTRKTFSLGDRVHVVLDRIDRIERKLQFALVEERPTPAQRGRKRPRY